MIILYSVIIAICLIFSAMFSAMDMSYSSVNILRLKSNAKTDKSAKRALKCVEDYETTIASILFGNDFVNILASSIATFLAVAILKKSGNTTMTEDTAEFIGAAILLIVVLMFGEIFPKEIAKSHSYAFAKFFSPFVMVISKLFLPFVWPTNKFAQFLTSPLIEKADDGEEAVASDDELQAIVDDIEREGIIDHDQSELLSKSIDFKETSCYEIMTPRVKVFAYDIDTPFEEFLKEPDVFKHSRIPVYKENLDHILGYIPVKTLLRKLVKEKKVDVKKILLPLFSVPRTMTISFVMAMMKDSHSHIAIVRDEFGGTEGIITLEDILEELVGEMWDESEIVDDAVKNTNKRNIYIVKGMMNISDFFARFHMDDEVLNEDYSTLSGWINDRLEKFARVGDKIKYGTVEIIVTKATEFTVEECSVHYYPRRRKDKE